MGVTRVAITGGVASGKSSLCHFLRNLGAYVISADQIVHQLLLHDTSVQKAIVQLFGQEVLEGREISKEKLGSIVFQNPRKLEALEAVLHPLVAKKIEDLFEENRNSFPLLVAEIPLLFETGLQKQFDATVAIWAPRPFSDKNNMKGRIDRQLSPQEKVKRSAFVILNKGSLIDLRKEASLLYRRLLEFL